MPLTWTQLMSHAHTQIAAARQGLDVHHATPTGCACGRPHPCEHHRQYGRQLDHFQGVVDNAHYPRHSYRHHMPLCNCGSLLPCPHA